MIRLKQLIKEPLSLLLLLLKTVLLKKDDDILSVYFHDPSPQLFERVIRYLAGRSYRFVSLHEFDDIIGSGKISGKIAVITIDDGWKRNLELVDVINKYGVYTTIFITTSAIESGNFWFEYILNGKSGYASMVKSIINTKRLDSENYYSEIDRLQKGCDIPRSAMEIEELRMISKNPYIIIGSHTVTHICLPGKGRDVQIKELLDSKEKLEEWIDEKVEFLSYPGGDYTEEQKMLASDCGYKLCFTTETTKINPAGFDRYAVPRRCVNDDAGYYESLIKIHGLWSLIRK